MAGAEWDEAKIQVQLTRPEAEISALIGPAGILVFGLWIW
jgi:hypothetical protein